MPRVVMFLVAVALVLAARPGVAQPRVKAGEVPDVGVDQQLNATLPLDAVLTDEAGNRVPLRTFFDKPVLLLFVYFRCPSICRPLMHELARTLDRLEGLTAGSDFRVLTISFDPAEGPAEAVSTRQEMLGSMKQPPPPEGWRFLTGDEATVERLTHAAGFRYRYDPDTQSFLHATSLIFVTTEGRIVRYIGGLAFLPAQLKMAIIDATEGRQRTFMQAAERLCYAYDPKDSAYVLKINRIIFGATLLLVLALAVFLFWRRHDHAKGG